MRNELTGKRLSAISTFQREIASPRCKAIDIDWRWYCDVCARAYLFMEESEADAETKTATETKRHAAECRPPAKALVVQFTSTLFRVRDLDTNVVTEYSREELADLVMSYRDAHNAQCPMPRTETWADEKRKNGGSPWRPKS